MTDSPSEITVVPIPGRVLPNIRFTARLTGVVHSYVLPIPLAVMRRLRRTWRRKRKAALRRRRGWV